MAMKSKYQSPHSPVAVLRTTNLTFVVEMKSIITIIWAVEPHSSRLVGFPQKLVVL